MRHKLLCFFLLICYCLTAQNEKTGSSRIDLTEAIQLKWITTKSTGLGGHSGESIKIVCKNIKGKTIQIRIPAGLLMYPADTAQQTLVVAEEQVFAVNAKNPIEIILKTFCTEAGDASPSAEAPFKVGIMAAKPICDLLKFAADKGIKDESALQNAVWCLSSGKPLGYIENQEILKFVADIQGKPMPGYRVTSKRVEEVPGRTADLGKAMEVTGNFKFYLEKDEKVVMNLVDENGKFIKQVSKEELMKKGEHRSGITLHVWNLNSGKYILRMQTKSGTVIKDMPVEF